MFRHLKNNKKTIPKLVSGFTLIELLVVIAIIGILSSVVLASLNTARAKARDARRLSDLKQIQAALAMYYSDNGAYPSAASWRGNCSGRGSYPTTGPTGYIPNLAPTYIKELPLEVKPTSNECYIYQSSAPDDYAFFILRTVEGVVPDSLKRLTSPAENTYAIYGGAGTSY